MMEPLEIDWKKLERHPLSAEYEDLAGERWEALVADIEATGFDKTRPVILHDGKVLDGWQRLRACIECDVEPEFSWVPVETSPETYVRRHNDNRRHETESQRQRRIEARRQRVAHGRAEGKSLRMLAEEEGVSHRTIIRDIDVSGGAGAPPETESPNESEDVDCVSSASYNAEANAMFCADRLAPEREDEEPGPETTEPETPPAPSPTVTGRDGKTYQATKPKPKPKPTEQQDDDAGAVLDDDETPVPAKLREPFSETNIFRRAAVALQRAAVALEEVEHSVAYALSDRQAATSGTGDRRVYSTACRTAEKRMLGMRPARVCCGDGCEACGGKGYLSVEEVGDDGCK